MKLNRAPSPEVHGDYTLLDAGEPQTRRTYMNATQVAGMVTTLLGFLGGYAMAKGFSAEQWTAIVGGVAAVVAWAVDYFWNKKPVA